MRPFNAGALCFCNATGHQASNVIASQKPQMGAGRRVASPLRAGSPLAPMAITSTGLPHRVTVLIDNLQFAQLQVANLLFDFL